MHTHTVHSNSLIAVMFYSTFTDYCIVLQYVQWYTCVRKNLIWYTNFVATSAYSFLYISFFFFLDAIAYT